MRQPTNKPTPACRSYDPEIWYPLSYTSELTSSFVQKAKVICTGCPLRIGCLEFALEFNEVNGIWGGLTPDERRGMRGERGGKDELFAALASA